MTETAGEAGEAGEAEPAAAPPARDRQFVQSLERGLSVIRALSAPEPQTLSEVARATGLTRAASRRFLLTLQQLGYVHLSGTRFALTPQVLELGYAYLSSLTLPEVAQPHLERLVEEIHESSSVGEADLVDVLAASDLQPLTPETLHDEPSLRAELDRVRTQGWALVDQELEAGLRSIAAPIHDRDGNVTAAINVSAQAARTDVSDVHTTLLPPLLSTARAIERDLAAARHTAG
jgi:IclR family pca regulon transcriptional regulator